MRVTAVRPRQLSTEQLAAWSAALGAEPGTDSPFFHPLYVLLLADVRRQVEVAVLEDGGEMIAFWPFERHAGGVARPLGIKLCDLQGVVARPGAAWTAEDLLRGCGLRAWQFDHLVASQSPLTRWHLRLSDSPYLDLSRGYEDYLQAQHRAGHERVAQTARKRRKLERDVGPVRFEWHTEDRAVFETLLAWKSAQRRRTGTFDVLQVDWVVDALEAIRATRTAEFAGVLSALYAADRLVAAHFGMRTGTVFHHWFPAYDPEFGKYSPGAILLLEVARHAAERGIRRVDLGKGDESYKRSFASADLTVAEGAADLRPLRHYVRAVWFRGREWFRNSSLHAPLRTCKRTVRRIQNQWAMR